jgi:hypothetical protein
MGGALGGAAILSLSPQGTLVEPTRGKIISNLATLALYLFMPSFLFISVSIKSILTEKRQKIFGYFQSIVIVTLSYSMYTWRLLPPERGYGLLQIDSQNTFLFAIMLTCFTIISIYYVNINLKINEKINFANKLLIWWFLSTTMFYILIKKLWYVDYFAEFTPVMSLMSSVALITILSSKISINKMHSISSDSKKKLSLLHKHAFIFYILLVFISAIFAANIYHSVDNPDRELSMSTNMNVSYYIKDKTLKNEPIFTAVPVFAVSANRPLFYNIAHPLMYMTQSDDPMPYDPNNIVPNTSEIINCLNRDKIEYVVADERTKSLFLSDRHPDIRDYILSNYIVETKIDNVNIYRFLNNSTIYFDSFETEKWKEDSHSFYGIERGTNFGSKANINALYPIVTDEITFVKYVFNTTTQMDFTIIEVTGNKRENMHSCTVWISQDGLTYEKIIEFDEVSDTTRKFKLPNYGKNDQIWLEFRMLKHSTEKNTPRIYNFTINANLKNNKSVEIKPYKNGTIYYNPTNLLLESSFERYKGSTNPPIAWSFTSTNRGTAGIDNTGFDGNYSYHVDVQNAREGIADMSQTFDLNENEYYRLNATHKQSGSGNAILLVQWFDENWEPIKQDRLNLPTTDKWMTNSIEEITPPNTKHGKVILRYETKSGDSGIVWFDDIKLQVATNYNGD